MRLFEREARGVKLTGKGHELLSHAERMLQVRRDMFEAAREQNVMSGTVRIGVAETIVQTWLPTLIELVHTAYPALVLEIEVDTTHVLRPHLLSRQIDLAFLMGPVLEARVENPAVHLSAGLGRQSAAGPGAGAGDAGAHRAAAHHHLSVQQRAVPRGARHAHARRRGRACTAAHPCP